MLLGRIISNVVGDLVNTSITNTNLEQEKLNEAIMDLNKQLLVRFNLKMSGLLQIVDLTQEINMENMNVELVARMFKNYRSNVVFHLEGIS